MKVFVVFCTDSSSRLDKSRCLLILRLRYITMNRVTLSFLSTAFATSNCGWMNNFLNEKRSIQLQAWIWMQRLWFLRVLDYIWLLGFFETEIPINSIDKLAFQKIYKIIYKIDNFVALFDQNSRGFSNWEMNNSRESAKILLSYFNRVSVWLEDRIDWVSLFLKQKRPKFSRIFV